MKNGPEEWVDLRTAMKIIGCTDATIRTYRRKKMIRYQKLSRTNVLYCLEDIIRAKVVFRNPKNNHLVAKRGGKRPRRPRVEAVCPRCKKRHQSQIFWSGEGIPRIYCGDCMGRVRTYEGIGENQAVI